MSALKQQSGVEWVGAVPNHWKVVPFKFCYTDSNAGEVIDKGHWNNGNELLYTCKKTPMKSSFSEFPARKRTTSNDLLLTRNGTPYVHLPDENSIYSNVVQRVKLNQEINREFAAYMLGAAAKQLRGFGDIIESFNMRTWNETIFLLPPQNEQKNLVKIIDDKITLIDSKISNLEKSILLLEEKRSTLISQAVTKGINSNVNMKDSEIKWLGSIPEHWGTCALKYLVSAPIIDGPHLTPIKHEKGVPFISAEAISGGYIDFEKKWGYISKSDHEVFSKRYSPKKGDILMVKLGATTGTVAIVETDVDFSVWVPLATIRIRKDFPSKFIFYFLQSTNIRDAIQTSWTHGTQQTLGLGTIANLSVPTLSSDEANEIVSFIESKVFLYEKAVKKSKKLNFLLQEYRSAWISAAITGKIDVRSL